MDKTAGLAQLEIEMAKLGGVRVKAQEPDPQVKQAYIEHYTIALILNDAMASHCGECRAYPGVDPMTIEPMWRWWPIKYFQDE